MIETEVKIRIDDPKAMRRRLEAIGAVVARERQEETNVLYDFPTGALRAAHQALRLRTYGRRTTLTFKGRREKSRSFKEREEFETPVGKRRDVQNILRGLGLRPRFTYSKKRTVLRKGRVVLTIDETSVGNFLEIEGKRHEITRLARSLGYSRADFITDSYVEMIERESRKERED